MPPLRELFLCNANRQAYRPLTGLIGFRRLNGFSLYPPRPLVGMARLGPAYSLSAGLSAAWPVGNTAHSRPERT